MFSFQSSFLTKGIRKNIGLALSLLLLSSFGFAFWFKSQQLGFVSSRLIQYYPLTFWLHTGSTIFLLFVTTWLFTVSALFTLGEWRNKDQIFLIDSLSYLSLLLVHRFPLHQVLFCFVVLKMVLLTVCLLFQRNIRWHFPVFHLKTFLVIVVAQAVLNGFLSPVSWGNPLAAVNRYESPLLPVYSPTYQVYYTLSKFLDLSGFDHSVWGSSPHSVGGGASLLVPLLTMAFNLPIIDVESYFRLLLQIFFLLSALGSFGFYLFLNKGLQLIPSVSLFGGILFLISNRFLGHKFTQHFPTFISVFLTLPWALLLSVYASRFRSLGWAWTSGILFALSFYSIQPHPDAIIHGAIFWVCFMGYLAFYYRKLGPNINLSLILISLAGLGVGSLILNAPVLESILTQESRVFGHQDAVTIKGGLRDGIHHLLIPMLKAFGVCWIMLLFSLKRIWGDKESRTYLPFFLIATIMLALVFVPRDAGPFAMMLKSLEVTTFSFANSARVEMYLSLCCLILALYGFQYFLTNNAPGSTFIALLAWLALMAVVAKKWTTASDLLIPLFGIGIGAFLLIRKTLPRRPGGGLHVSAVLAAVGIAILQEGTFAWESPRLMDNLRNCKPYITLQSLLHKDRLLPVDRAASLPVLRSRLVEFERDLISHESSSRANSYRDSLRRFAVASASQLTQHQTEELALETYPTIDSFYLEQFDCQYAPYAHRTYIDDWEGVYYNNISLYEKIGDRFQRMLTATRYPEKYVLFPQLGIGQGFFMNDSTQTLDANFISGYRPMYSLYLMPGEYFTNIGSYWGPSHWRLGTEIISDPMKRKMLNISGIDIYTFLKDSYSQVRDKHDLLEIPFSMPAPIRPPYIVVRDHRSYGMAYLATSIRYISPNPTLLKKPTPPLRQSSDIIQYKRNVDEFWSQLNTLNERHSILLEDPRHPVGQTIRVLDHNRVTIDNILGNKAAFLVQCVHEPCVLVFNQASIGGWRAFIDSMSAPIQRANFAFLSVVVPKGDHFVWFEHRRWSSILGIYFTLIGFLITAFWLCRVSFERKLPGG